MADENDVDDIPRQLPDELLIEILARMPVKSLIKFTCVCKLWQSLIKSPEFAARQYATRTSALSNYDCHHLMIYSHYYSPVGDITFISAQTLDISTVFECKPVISQPFPFPPGGYQNYSWLFYGPCNGIFCIRLWKPHDVMVLWNPSTQQVFKTASYKCRLSQSMGFGFDANSNDYKIVSFNCCDGRGPYRSQLYSLAANSWRDMEDSTLTFAPSKDLNRRASPSSNGRMCNWLGFHYTESYSQHHFLLSFDMVDEVFIETPIPDGVVEGPTQCSLVQCSLVQQRSHLQYPAIVSYGFGDSHTRVTFVNVWVLQEYGASGYWTKQMSVMLPDDIIVSQPRGFTKAGEVLFMDNWDDKVLTCYNYITQESKTLNSIHVSVYEQLIGYTESLLPIQTMGECEDSDPDYHPDYDYHCLCQVGQQPVCSNSCIF